MPEKTAGLSDRKVEKFMIELKHSCIGVRCPVCGKNVIEYINRFQFASGKSFVCPDCGAPLISIKNDSSGGNISLNCFACGQQHSYILSKKCFFSEKPASFCCKENDVDVLYTGNYHDVDIALFELDNEINLLTDKYYQNLEQVYGSLSTAALRILEDKAREKRIICLCGSHEMKLHLLEGGIDLICPHCGGSEFIPVANENDVQVLMDRRSILIK